MVHYVIDDRGLDTARFLALANSVWPGPYDEEKTRRALGKTINIAAYSEQRLVGCLRILTDGYYFGTITELLVLPEFQRRGIGSRLLGLARAHTSTLLYFGAQPGLEGFYERNGCKRGMQSYVIEKEQP